MQLLERTLGTTPATDEVIDAIADIEAQRQAMEKNAGLGASCSSALRKLHELLEREKEALQLHGQDAGHRENVETVTLEIERVKGLAANKGRNSFPGNGSAGRRQLTWRNAHRSPPRNKGRRTMGRTGGR